MNYLITLFVTLLFTAPAFAGVQVFNAGVNAGVFSKIDCASGGGLSCVKVGDKLAITKAVTPNTGAKTHFNSGWTPSTFASGTSTTGVSTSVYMTQVNIGEAVTLTGIGVANAATVGTNKYIFALFNSTGGVLATTALAGVTTAGASGYQQIAFTAPYTVTKAGTYWIGLYVNGTTDTFYTIPAVGAIGGLTGVVTGQTFGTPITVTLPTTFTAGTGPVAYTY